MVTNVKKYQSLIPAVITIFLVGAISYLICILLGANFADPLLVALIIGITVRSIVKFRRNTLFVFKIAPKFLIPVGIVFYAFKNINFVKYSKNDPAIIILTFAIIAVYFSSIILLGKLLKQKKEISYLVAASSGICGASAIAVTSNAMDAESDDVSVSLIAVTFIGILALFVIIPFLSTVLGLNNEAYALLAGTTLQFTGFVKAAMNYMPPLLEKVDVAYAAKLAVSVKAVRYLALLVAIPAFGSMRKNRAYPVGILGIFILSGVVGSFIYSRYPTYYSDILIPAIRPIYVYFWATAMAAIGLNADVRKVLSNHGLKAIFMALFGFICATISFFIGAYLIN